MPAWVRLFLLSLLLSLLGSYIAWADSSVVVTSLFTPGNANEPNRLRMLEDLKKDTGVELRYNSISGDGDVVQRLQILAGESRDIIYLTNTNNQELFASEGLILPLDQLSEMNGVDLKATYGSYLQTNRGKVYYLPAEISMQVVFYNKDIFDRAGVPYPKSGWTWDDYVAIARKLTDPSQQTWGSLMQNWDYLLYLGAHLRGVSDYRDGDAANFKDPAFKEALRWFGTLGNVEQIQPSWKAMSLGAANWTSMMTGKFAMTYNGSWHLGLFADRLNYPRNWRFGIAPPPVFAGYNKALVAGGAYAISRNSKHPEEAFRVIHWLAQNSYRYLGGLPALKTLSRDNFRAVLQDFVETRFKGDISVDDLYSATLGNGLDVVQEKIVGPAAPEINEVYMDESEKYLVGWQSLDATMAAIETRANQLIELKRQPQAAGP